MEAVEPLMNITESYKTAFAPVISKVSSDIRAALKTFPAVSSVTIEPLKTSELQLKVFFKFNEACVWALVDSFYIRPMSHSEYGKGTSDIVFKNLHNTVESMISAVSVEYPKFLNKLLDKVLADEVDNPTLSRRQRMLITQTNLIDAGFNAELKVLVNGDFRLVVSHDMANRKAPLKEVTIRL